MAKNFKPFDLLIGIYIFSLFISFVGWLYYYRGNEVAKVTFPLDSLKDTIPYTIENIKIPAHLKACEIEVTVNPQFTTKYDAYLTAEFYNEVDSVAGVITGDIYYDFGTDSDGAWSERKKEHSKFFKFTDINKGADLSVDVFLEKSKGFKDTNNQIKPIQKEGYIKVYTPDGLLSTYLGWACVVLLSIACTAIAFLGK